MTAESWHHLSLALLLAHAFGGSVAFCSGLPLSLDFRGFPRNPKQIQNPKISGSPKKIAWA